MRKGSASSAEIGSGKPCFTANDLSPVGYVVAAGMHLSTRILICHDTTHVALNFRRETAAALQGCLPVTCAQHCSCTLAGLIPQDILPRWDILTRSTCGLPCHALLRSRGLLGDRTIVVFETHFWLCFEVIYIAWQGLLKDHRPHKMLQHEDFVFPETSLLPDDMKPIVK